MLNEKIPKRFPFVGKTPLFLGFQGIVSTRMGIVRLATLAVSSLKSQARRGATMKHGGPLAISRGEEVSWRREEVLLQKAPCLLSKRGRFLSLSLLSVSVDAKLVYREWKSTHMLYKCTFCRV